MAGGGDDVDHALVGALQGRIASLQATIADLRVKRRRDRALIRLQTHRCDRLEAARAEALQRLARAESQYGDRVGQLDQGLARAQHDLGLADERAVHAQRQIEQLEQRLAAALQDAAAQHDRHQRELALVEAQAQSLDEARQAYRQVRDEIETQTAQFQTMEQEMHQQLTAMRHKVEVADHTVADLRARLDHSHGRIISLNADLGRAQAQLDVCQRALGRYDDGRPGAADPERLRPGPGAYGGYTSAHPESDAADPIRKAPPRPSSCSPMPGPSGQDWAGGGRHAAAEAAAADPDRLDDGGPGSSLAALQQRLSACGLEYRQLESELMRFPAHGAGRTVPQRKRKAWIEQRLAQLSGQMSQLKTVLRKMDALV